jgi:hypothetical protein
VKVFEEEVGVLARLDRINQIYPSPGNVTGEILRTQWRLANKEIEKAKSPDKSDDKSKDSGKTE